MSEPQKTIVYFSAWSSASELAAGSVRPTLEAISEYENPPSIIYVSVETHAIRAPSWLPSTATFVPICVSNGHSITARARKIIRTLSAVRQAVRNSGASAVLSRGAPAAGIASLATVGMKCHHLIESFEPHAEYMVFAGIWPRFGVRSLMAHILEWIALKRARWIATVSRRYQRELEKIVSSSTEVTCIPCIADSKLFYFDMTARQLLRTRMNLCDRFVIVYVGKFSGLYLDKEAFHLMARLSDLDQSLYFIILTPNTEDEINRLALENRLSTSDYCSLAVKHTQVKDFLSAADLGLGFHRPTLRSTGFSPIKYAEYWACGLPIVSPSGVGSDDALIHEHGLGLVTDILDELAPEHVISYIETLRRQPPSRVTICKAGQYVRNPNLLIDETNLAIQKFL